MKTRQLGATTSTAAFRAKQKNAGRMTGVGGGILCERERKHEAAMREREEQLKREKAATAAAAAAAQRVRQHRKIAGMLEKDQAPKNRITHPREKYDPGGFRSGKFGAYGAYQAGRYNHIPPAEPTPTKEPEEKPPNPDPKATDCEYRAERLRTQLEDLSQLSEQDFELGFRKWLDQEGIAREMHSHLRVELINCFNNTALGQLLNKAAGLQMAQSHALLLSPLALSLHTLVAEFLHSHNCHFTLSVFCSEMPHRQALPNFENRPAFTFKTAELEAVMTAVMGGQDMPADLELNRLVEAHYSENLAGQTQSLLMALMRSLVEVRREATKEKLQPEPEPEKPVPEEPVPPIILVTSSCQTEPSTILERHPEVDTSRLFQAEENELFVGADGRSVFLGARVSQALHAVDYQLGQLMIHLRLLSKSCVPPVEVISHSAFEQLLQRELRERERLTRAGESFNPAELLIKLPPPPPEKKATKKHGDVVYSDVGPIILPVENVSVPRLPVLHPEQLSSMAVVRQSLDQLHKKASQPQTRMFVSVERMEALVGEICGCMQLLGNILNLSMEQEHAVGRNKGFAMGYEEGFNHGHFMGIQEGQKKEQHDIAQKKKKLEREKEKEKEKEKDTPGRSVATQTSKKRTHSKTVIIQTEEKTYQDAGNQSSCREVYKEPLQKSSHDQKSYEQWIDEMLNSTSGLIFLERVELSLNKALELQKNRLDELYQVKLRHQAEMLRLGRRQSSWRVSGAFCKVLQFMNILQLSFQTLCKRVEHDSHSSAEAKDLVQKIFCLLEHYESHHQILSEKIQQTEQAAEQATRIVPLWNDHNHVSFGNWNSLISSSLVSSSGVSTPHRTSARPSNRSLAPKGAPIEAAVTPHVRHPYGDTVYPAVTYPCQVVAVTSAGHGGYLPAIMQGPAGNGSQGLGLPALEGVPAIKGPAGSTGSPDASPPRVESGVGVPAIGGPSGSTGSPDESPPSVEGGVGGPQIAQSARTSQDPDPAILVMPPPTNGNQIDPVPDRPAMQNAATNTMPPAPTTTTRSSQAPSFEEALQSAKNRMLQLEQESDLLEKSFLSYLEKTKPKSQTPPKSSPQKQRRETEEKEARRKLRSSCQRERAQINRSLDHYRDWQRKVRREDAISVAQLEELQKDRILPKVVESKRSSPLWLSEPEDGQQDKYPFTNAIAEARQKLLGEIGHDKREDPVIPRVEQPELQDQLLDKQEDWLAPLPPVEIPVLPRLPEPFKSPALPFKPSDQREPLLSLTDLDHSRSSRSSGELSLLFRRAKEALGVTSDPNPLLDSSSDSSSFDLADGIAPSASAGPFQRGSPSQKLQRSMAKMQLLFGGSGIDKEPISLPLPSKVRPVSAPTAGSGLRESLFLGPSAAPRPQTAPAPPPVSRPAALHLDISTSSSTPSSLSRKSPALVFQDLVADAVMGPDTTPEVSFSQEFWKRVNL
ncbi:hypothetical protein KR074_002139 [Drosophila pseudoananassae]|nr:hypothetical protein KR074_002139 [Drosophila pseudoananassae]